LGEGDGMTESGTRSNTYARALGDALRLEMLRDERVIVMGEDVGETGGVFTVTRGLWKEFGDNRVIDTPISETAFLGAATGAAISGMRPVVELMFADFSFVAADQLFNQVAKLGFLGNGKVKIPITIRTQQGISGGGGATHSQSVEALFVHVPGIAVAVPSTAADAKGLLAAAIRSDEPAVVIEHKALYFNKGDVPEGEYVLPFGQAAVRRSGSDLTIVSWSKAVDYSLAAADVLAEDGIQAEVIDLRTLTPLDMETIAASVAKTGRVLVVQEAPRAASAASEVVSRISEECWPSLRQPPRRVAGLEIPLPYARPLEQFWLPNPERITLAAKAMLGAEATAGS
jgi:acetoin:2,6-dichlorophenolindophenol oxidoreductase subunit beta